MKKVLLRVGVALLPLLVAIAATVAMTSNSAPSEAAEEEELRLSVDVITVTPGLHSPMAEWTGEVVARRQVTVHAPYSADVVSVDVSEGVMVEAGQRLLALNTQTPRWELASLQADQQDFEATVLTSQNQQAADRDFLAYEQTLLAQAEAKLERERGLLQRGVSTEAALEQAQLAVTQARQSVRMRQLSIDNHASALESLSAQRLRLAIALERQQDVLSRAVPEAPFTGRVARMDAMVGQNVSAGQSLVTLYAPESLSWRVVMPNHLSRDVQAIIGGRIVSLQQLSGAILSGEVGRYAWFGVPEESAWVPGDTRSAWVVLPAIPDTFLLPSSALYAGGRVFLVAEDGSLASASVNILGVTQVEGQEFWLADAANLPPGSRVLVTRIANVLAGMSVDVRGEYAMPNSGGATR